MSTDHETPGFEIPQAGIKGRSPCAPASKTDVAAVKLPGPPVDFTSSRLNRLTGAPIDHGKASRTTTNSQRACRQRGASLSRNSHCANTTNTITTDACHDARQSQAKKECDRAGRVGTVRISPFLPVVF